ncbi:hypothetical protein [Billgrantia ethanolica]|uniref:YtxH domain-containing protein n=1 Tax=Billgrantia ethanolica TaxID=2733486 RepID=A0ABS9A4N2_9GAMM|nr:hypothetical protein [Halomonas ethanolica]MCE8003751.1 hypothetical protein [Halomonas ethanolica]
MRKTVLPTVLILLALSGLGGCDGPKAGERMERNIDRSMENLQERWDAVGKDIQEDVREEAAKKENRA